MNLDLSKMGLSIEQSITLEISAKAAALKKSGENIINFSVGEPDFKTPENIQQAGIEAITSGITKYTPASGTPILKEAICKKFELDNSLFYKPSEIIVSNGGKHSLYNALMSILNPGDEVMFGIPYWVSYPELVTIAGGKPVMIKTLEENNFKFSSKDLEAHLTNRTKAIIINSPSNPTGAVYNKKELEDIADWAVKNNIFVISDELYEKLIYDSKDHISIASLNKDIKSLTITINGVSKAYAMTGWRIGYAAADERVIKIMSNIQSHTTSNPSSISQHASVEALVGNQNSIIIMKVEFDKRRKAMASLINSIKGISCSLPEGAFYAMLNFSQIKGRIIDNTKIDTSLDFANLLLDKCKVAVVPGIAFGDDNYVRLSYATSLDNINLGLIRVKNLLGSK